MGIQWKLKSYVAEKHQIYRVTELQKRIRSQTGVLISLTNLSNYLAKRPQTLRLSTIEILCTALECKLSDFFQISPKTITDEQKKEVKKLAYHNTPLSKRGHSAFPDPKDYA